MSITTLSAGTKLGFVRSLVFTTARDTLSATWAPMPGAMGYRMRGRKVSERPVGGAYDGFTWETIAPYLPASASPSFSVNGYIWSGLQYDFQVAAVDVNGNMGPWLTLQVTAPAYLQQRLTRDNADLSQTRSWKYNGGTGTVTRFTTGNSTNGPYTRVTLPVANMAFNQVIPMQSVAGRDVTVRAKLRTTDGSSQTVSVFCHNDDGSEFYAYPNVTVSGTGWTPIVFTRPRFANAGRSIRIGVQSYASATATSLDIEYLDVSPGTDTASPVVLTDGYTLQEALSVKSVYNLYPVSTDPTAPTVITSHHISTDPTISAAEQDVTQGAVLFQGNHITCQGNGIQCVTGFPTYTAVQSARVWVTEPTVAGNYAGKGIRTGFSSGTVIENCYLRGGTGILVQNRRNAPTITSGVFAAGNFRIRYNKGRDFGGRISDGAGSYVHSNYSNIQGLPKGAQIGYYVSNFVQFAGMTADATGETIPPIIERNEVSARPGFALIEDVISMIQQRGTGRGYPFDTGLPYRVDRNWLGWCCIGWDWPWHAANDTTRKYNFSGVDTSFTLQIRISGSQAAGQTSLYTKENLYLNKTVIPAGTTLTFTGGKTVVLSQPINSASPTINNGTQTRIDVNTTTFAFSDGDTATWATADNPGPFSGTNIMNGDGYVYSTTPTNGDWEKQSAFGTATGNIGVSHSAIFSICAGRHMRHVAPEVITIPQMIDGLVQHDGSRPGYGIILSFNDGQVQMLDKNGVYRSVWGSNGITGMIGNTVASVDLTIPLTAAIAAGATSTTTTVPFPDPIPTGQSIIFRDAKYNGNQIGTAVAGAGHTAGSTTVPLASLSGAIPANSFIQIKESDSFKPLLTYDNTLTGPSANTYLHALRRWSQWRDEFAANSLTLGPATA